MEEKGPNTMAYNVYFKLLLTCGTKHELLHKETKAKSIQWV
jgi:hypothetical protein